MRVARGLVALAVVLASSGGVLAPGILAQPAASSWQGRIQRADRQRLAGLWGAWTRSLAQIDAAGMRGALEALGTVGVPPVEPLPGRPGAPVQLGMLPGAGAYQCRLIRLGLREDGWPRDDAAPLSVGPWGACALEVEPRRETLQFDMLEGEQRMHGRLWADGDRMVFLGAKGLASEAGTRRYGDDPDRDALGVLRPLEAGHWRLELPWPRWQSNLLLVEIKPA